MAQTCRNGDASTLDQRSGQLASDLPCWPKAGNFDPGPAMDNILDRALADLEKTGNRFNTLTSPVHRQSLKNVRSCQDGIGASLALQLRPVQVPVRRVLFRRPPVDVLEPVVGRVTVGEVSAFETGRTRADERFQDELMDVSPMDMSLIVPDEADPHVFTTPTPNEGFQPLPDVPDAALVITADVATPHAPIIADAIAGVSLDVSIANRGNDRCDRLDVGHDVLLAEAFCRARPRTTNPRAGHSILT
jgi:hypothetical protein